jgi:hypothetical protein
VIPVMTMRMGDAGRRNVGNIIGSEEVTLSAIGMGIMLKHNIKATT